MYYLSIHIDYNHFYFQRYPSYLRRFKGLLNSVFEDMGLHEVELFTYELGKYRFVTIINVVKKILLLQNEMEHDEELKLFKKEMIFLVFDDDFFKTEFIHTTIKKLIIGLPETDRIYLPHYLEHRLSRVFNFKKQENLPWLMLDTEVDYQDTESVKEEESLQKYSQPFIEKLQKLDRPFNIYIEDDIKNAHWQLLDRFFSSYFSFNLCADLSFSIIATRLLAHPFLLSQKIVAQYLNTQQLSVWDFFSKIMQEHRDRICSFDNHLLLQVIEISLIVISKELKAQHKEMVLVFYLQKTQMIEESDQQFYQELLMLTRELFISVIIISPFKKSLMYCLTKSLPHLHILSSNSLLSDSIFDLKENFQDVFSFNRVSETNFQMRLKTEKILVLLKWTSSICHLELVLKYLVFNNIAMWQEIIAWLEQDKYLSIDDSGSFEVHYVVPSINSFSNYFRFVLYEELRELIGYLQENKALVNAINLLRNSGLVLDYFKYSRSYFTDLVTGLCMEQKYSEVMLLLNWARENLHNEDDVDCKSLKDFLKNVEQWLPYFIWLSKPENAISSTELLGLTIFHKYDDLWFCLCQITRNHILAIIDPMNAQVYLAELTAIQKKISEKETSYLVKSFFIMLDLCIAFVEPANFNKVLIRTASIKECYMFPELRPNITHFYLLYHLAAGALNKYDFKESHRILNDLENILYLQENIFFHIHFYLLSARLQEKLGEYSKLLKTFNKLKSLIIMCNLDVTEIDDWANLILYIVEPHLYNKSLNFTSEPPPQTDLNLNFRILHCLQAKEWEQGFELLKIWKENPDPRPAERKYITPFVINSDYYHGHFDDLRCDSTISILSLKLEFFYYYFQNMVEKDKSLYTPLVQFLEDNHSHFSLNDYAIFNYFMSVMANELGMEKESRLLWHKSYDILREIAEKNTDVKQRKAFLIKNNWHNKIIQQEDLEFNRS